MCWWKFLLLWLLFALSHMSWQQCNETFSVTPSTSSWQCRYSLSGEQALTTGSIVFYIFLLFFCSSVCLCLSHSVVDGSLCNQSQVFKNLLLWGSQWPLKQKIIKTQWLTLSEWGCRLDNHPKLAKISVSKHLGILPSFSTWFVVWYCVMILWNVMVSSLV